MACWRSSTEPTVIGLFRRIPVYFLSGELAFNDYGHIGWFSQVAVKLAPQKMFSDVSTPAGLPGF